MKKLLLIIFVFILGGLSILGGAEAQQPLPPQEQLVPPPSKGGGGGGGSGIVSYISSSPLFGDTGADTYAPTQIIRVDEAKKRVLAQTLPDRMENVPRNEIRDAVAGHMAVGGTYTWMLCLMLGLICLILAVMWVYERNKNEKSY